MKINLIFYPSSIYFKKIEVKFDLFKINMGDLKLVETINFIQYKMNFI